LHYGHVSYLEEAKAKGDILVVALNSDASVKRLKGNTRPVVCQKFRAAVIAALGSVDFVVIFDEDTPYSVISSLQPDVLVKGGDWKAKDIVGSDLVLARGGKVMSIRYVPGFSTTIYNKNFESRIDVRVKPYHRPQREPSERGLRVSESRAFHFEDRVLTEKLKQRAMT
jgi:rfaE bifunctional protein nucleotidyltransferase chain/domain